MNKPLALSAGLGDFVVRRHQGILRGGGGRAKSGAHRRPTSGRNTAAKSNSSRKPRPKPEGPTTDRRQSLHCALHAVAPASAAAVGQPPSWKIWKARAARTAHGPLQSAFLVRSARGVFHRLHAPLRGNDAPDELRGRALRALYTINCPARAATISPSTAGSIMRRPMAIGFG